MTQSDQSSYRYWLTRHLSVLGNGGTVLFVMLNPSTADQSQDDPTIRRCMGFARDWGYADLKVANLYALRSTDPRGLFESNDPVGVDNLPTVDRLAAMADEIIAAWGATPHPGGQDHVRQVLDILSWHQQVRCLGVTAGGHPRHPLYVKKDAARIPLTHRLPVAA